MVVPPESIEGGKCYLTASQAGPRLIRVIAILADGRVQHEYRHFNPKQTRAWRPGILDQATFARMAEQEVACDWTPERDG